MALPRWIQILRQVGPAILAFTPAAPFIPAVLAGIEIAENTGGTGAEKKAKAIETAVEIANGINAVKGAPVVDPQQLGATVSSAIDTAVGVANLVDRTPDAPVA